MLEFLRHILSFCSCTTLKIFRNAVCVYQNRRQKVFNRGLCVSAGGFGFVRGGLTL